MKKIRPRKFENKICVPSRLEGWACAGVVVLSRHWVNRKRLKFIYQWVCSPVNAYIEAGENERKAFALTVMASFHGRIDIGSSRGNEQPSSYMVYSSVTVRGDAYVRTSSDGNTGGVPRVAPPQSSSRGVPFTTAGRMYSPSDFGPVPRICLKRRHDEHCCDPGGGG